MSLICGDNDPSIPATIPGGTTADIQVPGRGSVTFNYSCANYQIRNNDTATVPNSDLTGIRPVLIVDPNDAASRQEGLTTRTASDFICGDQCKSYPVGFQSVGPADTDQLVVEITNTNVAAASVTLEIFGRRACFPVMQSAPAPAGPGPAAS